VPTEFDLAMRSSRSRARVTIVRDSSAWDMFGPMTLAALFLREDGLACLGNLSENRSLLEGA
jgi:hypothetical protein